MIKILPKLISAEFCDFFTHILQRQGAIHRWGDDLVPNALATMSHSLVFDTMHEKLWPVIEQSTNLKLHPTYSYARLYGNGDELEPHRDRSACEISVTIQLGRSHDYSWPIFMGGQSISLDPGDAVVYSGCDVLHWREVCNGPPDYYSGQLFLHYVDAAGRHAEWANDKRPINNLYSRSRICDV